jgi:hypothetical protein
MPTIVLSGAEIPMEQELGELALEWNCEMRRTPEGYLFLPEYMMRIHGINFDLDVDGKRWECWRDAEATSWEDFLLMHITHYIGDKYGLLLEYEFSRSTRLVEPRIDLFTTFDTYVEQVVAKEDGVVKDIKKNWMYAHRSRNVR